MQGSSGELVQNGNGGEDGAGLAESNRTPNGIESSVSVGLDVGILSGNANEPIGGHSYLATGFESARQARPPTATSV